MFDQYSLGVDVSHWQNSVDWPRLSEAGVQFAIVKASQGGCGRDESRFSHLKQAAEAGLICGVYHWFDPGSDPQAQLTNFSHAISGLDFQFLALDVEQYWRDWDPALRADKSNHYSGRVISDGSRSLAEMMRRDWQMPVSIYTRTSFVDEYAPEMNSWLPDWPLWLAHYPYNRTRVSLGWQTLKQQYVPAISGPALPRNCERWNFWQFSGDKFNLPGSQTVLDLNFFNGSRTELLAWLGQSTEEKPLSAEEKISLLWQAHPQLWSQEQAHANQ